MDKTNNDNGQIDQFLIDVRGSIIDWLFCDERILKKSRPDVENYSRSRPRLHPNLTKNSFEIQITETIEDKKKKQRKDITKKIMNQEQIMK